MPLESVADPGFQKRGARFFFFCFFLFFFFAFQQAGKGGGGNFAKKKQQQGTNHRRVFNSTSIYQNIPLEILGRGGGGVWGPLPPRKKIKKIGTKSCNSKHF